MERILVIDDDVELCQLVSEYLRAEGFAIDCVHDGESGLKRAHAGEYLLAVLDVMLPGINGFEVLRRIRATSRLPVLLLTARGEDVDRIVGLEIGADDYLPKPFNPRELLARIRAVLRRADGPSAQQTARRLSFGIFVADLDTRNVTGAGEAAVDLTSAEFDLLACFLERANRVLARTQLLDGTRGRAADPFDRTIDVSVSRLRRKLALADPNATVCIKTVRNG